MQQAPKKIHNPSPAILSLTTGATRTDLLGLAQVWVPASCFQMDDEVLFTRGTTHVRRLRLAPGEAMPWHRDPYYRVTVVLHGTALAIEYRDGGERQRFEVTPGQVDWDEPTDRLHRGVNVGEQPYEEVTVFLLDRPGAVPQPREE